MPKKKAFNYIYLVLIVLGVLLLQEFWTQNQLVATIAYSEFKNLLRTQQISELTISEDYIRGQLKEPRPDKKTQILTTRVDLELAEELEKYGVKYNRIVENNFIKNILSWVLPILIFFAIWIYIGKKMAEKGGGLGGGFLSVGKSKAKIFVEKDIKTTFADIAGIDEAKDDLKEIVRFLKNPDEYGKLGARMPKGVLLVGPPGTGKTLLAKAVAGEAGVPFFSISGSEFVELFVGVGAARVRDLFEQARKSSPCIIFIDELDALGRARSIGPLSGGHDEKEQTLNQLLAELDGFDSRIGVVLLAATNRPEILDPALLRAGRFDRQILVDKPDKKGRFEILKVHTKKIKMDQNLPLDQIAAMTPGFTGADIENLVNEAALIATKKESPFVSLNDFVAAIERIVAGLEKKNKLLNPVERKVVAYHEMGHALVATKIPGSDKVHKISVVPRGIGSLGYTIQRPIEDRYLMTKEELINKMTVLLGGREAEKLIFNHISTGGADDIARATDIARHMVLRYGMSDQLGSVVYELDPPTFLNNPNQYPFSDTRKFSESTAKEIDITIKGFVDQASNKSKEILKENLEVLNKGADLLLIKETLTEEDLKELFRLQ